MLQYILTNSENFSPAELAQMAVEGGCRWISLATKDPSDDESGEFIDPTIIELCREAGVILTIDDKPHIARKLGLHGVRLSAGFMEHHTPMEMREELGPEAIIGIETDRISDCHDLITADIDFIILPKECNAASFVESLNNHEIHLPVVAPCESVNQAIQAMTEGCSGVAMTSFITTSTDPVRATEEIIKRLGKAE